jgi:hypothetical protein
VATAGLVASMIVRYKCITQAGHCVWLRLVGLWWVKEQRLKWPTNVSNCLVMFIYSSFSIFISSLLINILILYKTPKRT